VHKEPSNAPMKQLCPYFQPINAGGCTMTKGGLYIPLPEHIEEFCKTPRFSDCQQYLRGRQLLRQAAQETAVADSRRHFPRRRSQLPVILAHCDAQGKPMDVIDSNAITIDLSLGGLGLQSAKELPASRVLHFQLLSPRHQQRFAGTGEVRWSFHDQRSGRYRAGLSFVDNTISQELREHFDL